MKDYSQWNNTSWKFVYTIPWPLPVLYISTLTNDDTTSICPVVQTLIIDKVCSNISHRFPNIVTLLIQPGCSLPSNDYTAFRRLRHLTTTNITQVPSSVLQRLHTLTLSNIDDLIDHPVVYWNIKHFIIRDNQIGSSTPLRALVQHFPHLHTLEIQLAKNDDYYDNLNILLNAKHLCHLSVLKTNWVEERKYCFDINLWLKAKTNLKWRTIPFHGICDGNGLTICL